MLLDIDLDLQRVMALEQQLLPLVQTEVGLASMKL
uniref:Uncharacterized protein n=1 Tax=Picea sitchensis TaxID=3332 RepID=A0A6B9XQ39_PICSI|nr:hypothetical protein Q903MT_gene4157 [Picea sitchensis]